MRTSSTSTKKPELDYIHISFLICIQVHRTDADNAGGCETDFLFGFSPR